MKWSGTNKLQRVPFITIHERKVVLERKEEGVRREVAKLKKDAKFYRLEKSLYNDFICGGRGGTWTLTVLLQPDFESSASTSSATRPA